MAVMKWHSELEIFRKIKPCIVLEGNTLDRFYYENDPGQRLRDVSEYVMQLLRDAGYQTIVYYNEAIGFYSKDPSDIDRMAQLCGTRAVNGKIPCPFSGSGVARGGALNQKDNNIRAGLAGKEKGSNNQEDNEELSLREMVSRCLDQCNQATAIIMDMASRYIVSPDAIQMGDVRAFADLTRVMRTSRFVMTNGEPSKNVIVLIVNKVNDLPTWFYLNNPDVKTIHVQTPDSNARMEFVSEENLKYFFDHDIWEAEKPVKQEDYEELNKLQERFVGMTEGFTFSDLAGMRMLCRNEKYHLSQLPSVVEFYRYGIRDNKWNQIKREKIREIEKNLRSRVIGQDQAIDKVVSVVKRSALQKGGNRPRGVLFFAGPTGTGKTETAKVLAESIFGDESCCIRFDMSEYRQDQSDQKLLGAPPGYVGYEAGGQLTNAVRDNPFSILLFDEIEKAHPSILDKFLQILDDGRLTDGQGKTVYFSESIIIFTSNKGIMEEVERRDEYGFPQVKTEQVVFPSDSPEQVQEKVRKGIENYFIYSLGRPELYNRIGANNIVVYDFIREYDSNGQPLAGKILKNQMNNCCKAIKNDLGISVNVDDAYDSLLEEISQESVLKNGGRGIRNLVETRLLTPLYETILDRDVPLNSTLRVTGIGLTERGKPVLDTEVIE